MKMLKTKHFRRLAVFLAMIAPAVYLFGSLFSALTGAHGTQVFASSDAESVNTSVVLHAGYINGDGVYGDAQYGFSVSSYIGVVDGQTGINVDVGSAAFADLRVFFYESDFSFISSSIVSSPNPLSYSLPSGASYYALRFYSRDNPIILNADIVFSGAVSDFYGAVSFSDYLFGQFFDKDNFLVQWGRNAISETPHGFAPFGAFWRYLDVNVLHFSNDQMGLMGYGYMYYCCHVLLFDIAFILVTFFLDFIQKVNDKVVGGVD